MRILFLLTGRKIPSSRFRILQLVPHLRRLGHRCVVSASHPPMYAHYRWLGWRASQRLRRELRRFDLLRLRLQWFDVVYLERELFDDDAWDIEQQFRRHSRTLVLDVDDAIFLRHPAKFSHVAGMCDGVIAGNQALRDVISQWNQNVSVVPTCVDLGRYPQRNALGANERPIIGWTGTKSNIGYLELIAEPLRTLATQIDFELRIIADDPGPLAMLDLQGVNVRFVPWQARREGQDLQPLDVGLMPLPDNDWTRYKCGLKIVQYMAVGVPAVASPVGVNSEIVRPGENGFLANSPDEWLDALRRLLRDPALQAELGANARGTVEQHYSIQSQLPHWLAAVEAARNRGEITGSD